MFGILSKSNREAWKRRGNKVRRLRSEIQYQIYLCYDCKHCVATKWQLEYIITNVLVTIESWQKKRKDLRKFVLTLVQTSKTPNKTTRVLMLRAIRTSGDEKAGWSCSMAIGVYRRKTTSRYLHRSEASARRTTYRPTFVEQNWGKSNERPVSGESLGLFSTTTRAVSREERTW